MSTEQNATLIDRFNHYTRTAFQCCLSLSATPAVGEVAQARIPWTMPEDVDSRTFPTLDARGGFSSLLNDSVPFVFVDGSVQLLPTSTPTDVLHAFFTINGGEVTE
jgi:hypothetical protein